MPTSPFPAVRPSNTTIEKNNEVRKALISNGDNGTNPRHVQHFLYPEYFPVRSREKLCARLKELGFVVTSAEQDHGLIAEQYREVASPEFDSLTEALERMMTNEGWLYDGWGCVAVNSSIN